MSATLLTLLAPSLLIACGPKDAAIETAAAPAHAVNLAVAAPTPTSMPIFTPPKAQEISLAGGGSLWLVERPGLPLVSLRMLVPGGKAADPADAPGTTAIADEMLTHGAGDLDGQAFAAASDQLAISLGASTSDTYTTLVLDTHTDRLEPALDLLALAVLSPRFDADEVDRVKEVTQGEITVALSSPGSVASWVRDRVWYGDGHVLSGPAGGTPDSVSALTATQLRASWESRRSSAAPHFVVVGDVTAAGIQPMLEERFGSWAVTGTAPAAPPPAAAVSEGPALYLVDNPGSAQTMLNVVMPGPSVTDDSVDAARLGSVVLGGTFTSRLNRLLREEKGYTYGARASLYPAQGDGLLLISTAVQRDVTAPALTDLMAELARLQEGLTDDEIIKAFGAGQTRLIDSSSSRSSLANSYSNLFRAGLGTDAFATQVAAQTEVTAASALAALSTATAANAAVIVVGDLAEIQAGVAEAMPGDWQVLSKWGTPIE